MYIEDRLFSERTEEVLYSVSMTEEEYDLYSEFQKEFGASSKTLAVLSPGAYQAKEAAKYAYDDDEYKNKRLGYAIKGLFTPGTATFMKKKAEEMAAEGKSKAEIRKYLEKTDGGRIAAGVGEVVTGASSLGHLAAIGVGIHDKATGNRAGDKVQKNGHKHRH